MINYFKELLRTLKLIEQHLNNISKCVSPNAKSNGVRSYLNTGHWNE